MERSDCFRSFFWLLMVLSFPQDVLKCIPCFERDHSSALGTPQGLGNLSQGSWQGTLSSPFKTFVGCQSEVERPGCNGNPVPGEEMRTESSRPRTSGGERGDLLCLYSCS